MTANENRRRVASRLLREGPLTLPFFALAADRQEHLPVGAGLSPHWCPAFSRSTNEGFSSSAVTLEPFRALGARFFRTSERFWLNLQTAYDLDVERDRLGARLGREVKILRQAG